MEKKRRETKKINKKMDIVTDRETERLETEYEQTGGLKDGQYLE